MQPKKAIVILAGIAQVEDDFAAIAVRVFQGRCVSVRRQRPVPYRFVETAGSSSQITRVILEVGLDVIHRGQTAVAVLVDDRQRDVAEPDVVARRAVAVHKAGQVVTVIKTTAGGRDSFTRQAVVEMAQRVTAECAPLPPQCSSWVSSG